jgi:hypothetical protein
MSNIGCYLTSGGKSRKFDILLFVVEDFFTEARMDLFSDCERGSWDVVISSFESLFACNV